MLYQSEYAHPGFERISQHFYGELISRNPISATWIGEHHFDGLLPETGAEAVERNIAFMRELRSAFAALPENELNLDERIDRETVIQFVNLHLFWEEDLQRWKLGRDLAMTIGESIFLLFTRDFAPMADRVLTMIARLNAVPPYLMGSKNLFQKVPAAYGEIYLESAINLPHLLDNIEKSLSGLIPAILLADFQRASITAKNALTQFTAWLKQAVLPKADADWALGPSAFQAMLAVKKSGVSSADLGEMAQRLVNESNERLQSLSCLILGVATGSAAGAVAEVQKRINSHAPTNFAMALSSFRDAIKRCRNFVETSNFATLPEKEELEIIETPSFMAHLVSISAYISPEKRASRQKGLYMLTRAREEAANHHSFAQIINSAIHDAYPGRHLQLAALNSHPGLMRSFCASNEVVDGWARYCQRRVREMGFESSQESYFAHATADLFDSTRTYAELQLQTRNWSFDQAVNYLADKNHLPRPIAVAEITRQIVAPGQQLCGILGEHTLQQLKESLQRRFKGDYSDKVFHDLVLYQGGIPLYLARQYYPEIVQSTIKSGNRF